MNLKKTNSNLSKYVHHLASVCWLVKHDSIYVQFKSTRLLAYKSMIGRLWPMTILVVRYFISFN